MDLLKNLNNMITAKLILTGKETYDSEYPTVSKYDALDAMIEFAKLHAVEILKKLSKTEMEYQRNIQYVYPLSNIK